MAELILTQQEKEAISWLDLGDEALGKLCRSACLTMPKILEDTEDSKRIWAVNAAMLLCNVACDANSEHTTFEFSGLTHGNKSNGDWRVDVTRVSK